MSASHNIAAERSAWLQSLCADKDVKLSALRVAVIIANHINGKIGEAWPSQSTIARLIGIERHNVNRAISSLVDLGYLKVRKAGQLNRYSMSTRIQPDTPAVISPDTAGGEPIVVELNRPKSIQPDNISVSDEITDMSPVGYPICDEPREMCEGGAYSAPLTTDHFASSVLGFSGLEDVDRAPEGAVLSDDELYEADIFFGELFEEDRRDLTVIKSTMGPARFYLELEALIEHGDAMPGIRGWARSLGVTLPGVRDAA